MCIRDSSQTHQELARERFLWEERYHAANGSVAALGEERESLRGEIQRLGGEIQRFTAEIARLSAEAQRLYDDEGKLRAAVDDQTSHLGRTYTEIERLTGIIRTMEATRAWRLHQWLGRRS